MELTLRGFALHSTTPGLIRLIRSTLVGGGLLSLAFFCGCQADPSSHQVSAPPPAAPLGRSANPPPPDSGSGPQSTAFAPLAASETTIVVLQVPRFPQQEAVRPSPSRRYVWLAGYWTWRNDGYEWIAGHWEQPPGNSSLWIRPRWARNGGSYLFHEGHWN